jgi:hypothetical protein
MIVYNWVVSQLDCLPQDGDLKDFVVVCHWRRQAHEIVDGKEYNADVYSTQSFSPDNVENFIPYEDLTFDIVCGWLESSMDVEAIDANLDTQIANLINPPIVSPPLPWAPAPVPPTLIVEEPVLTENNVQVL